MNNKKIDIITVNYKSLLFLFALIFAVKKLSYFHNKIIIRDNGSNVFSRMVLKLFLLFVSKKDIDIYFFKQTRIGGMGHGEALNFLSDEITSEFGAIFDVDCIPLLKNWDKLLIDSLVDNIKVIGTQASLPKKQDFPYVFGMVFESAAFKKTKIDFLPGKVTQFDDTQDTGYKMREIFYSNNFGNSILKKTSKNIDEPFFGIPSSEYMLANKIIMSHFGRGSNPLGKNMLFLFKKKIFEKIFRYPSWLFYKYLWIYKVIKIIKNESRI